MKILQIIDSPWAIGALAKVIAEKNTHHWIETVTIHPKECRTNPNVFIQALKEKINQFQPEIVHFHYWDVANTLRPHIPEGIKVILTHHNQKNLLSHDWMSFDHLVVHTKKAKDILTTAGYGKVSIIQHGIDVEKFKFKENYETNTRLIGYVGRIVPWKNLLPILKVAEKLDTEVVMMGKIDKADYWNQCMEYSEQMDERFNTPSEEQVNVYHEMAVYVGNSDDNIEEGPLGLLEAMACGIPVITTPSGEAADIIEDGKNGILIPFNDELALESRLRTFFQMSKEERDKMREAAWSTIKNMTADKMALQYEKLYYKVKGGRDLVSVIIPTHNRAEHLTKILDAYADQSYENIEIIICDDGSTDNTIEICKEFGARRRDIPVTYINTHNQGYGLAQARNEGIFEAVGHYIVFSDDRMLPDKNAVKNFVSKLSPLKEKSAVWGKKDESSGRSFIENFFIIRKKDIVRAGMFNERGNEYGFQSQEVRERLFSQDFKLEYCPEARAYPIFGTRRNKRRYEIVRSKFKLYKLGL